MSIFKKIFVVLLAWQMLFLPIAPVLAEESSTPAFVPSYETTTNHSPVTDAPFVSTASSATTSEITSNTNNGTSSSTISSAPVKPAAEEAVLPYASLMRQARESEEGKIDSNLVAGRLERFIKSEKDRLEKLGVDSDKQTQYFALLSKRLDKINHRPTAEPKLSLLDKVKNVLGIGANETQPLITEVVPTVPDSPATFHFNTSNIIVESLSSRKEASLNETLNSPFLSLFRTPDVYATSSQIIPTISDVVGDSEVVITGEIKELAHFLHNNPAEIYNYVRNSVHYEPYFGAKKGGVGCLHQLSCNDVDASSLVIALMRASGIPARYKKSIVVMPVAQLQQLLGVDETKTTFGALAWNKVPVYTLSDANNGKTLEAADFNLETSLAVQWVFAEIYYDYDERGGNFTNNVDLSTATTTAEVQLALQNDSKRQWMPLDVVVRPYTHTKNEIVADTAQFNPQTFWNSYLQYQGNLSPVEKYASDLQSATNKDINNANFQSVKTYSSEKSAILPPTLPYYTRTGEVGGSLIQPEAWSTLPDVYRQVVRVSLLKEGDKSVVMQNAFFGVGVDNKEMVLNYQGAADIDKQTIDSYGGIASTPSALVDIKPFIEFNGTKIIGNQNMKIGDKLILQFEYLNNNNVVYKDQKFSLAGNEEGIYISLSKVEFDPNLNTNSKILLRGNVGLAREYLKTIQTHGDLLKKSLDYEYNIDFSRAVVTQNRILTEVDGVPTTFDFKGLMLDAGTYINDYSNRGNYKNHRKDFRLLWGIDASREEGQLFTDIAGLEGISTVKGLQYAYANPGTYTVYSINSSTPNFQTLIGSFALSASTKVNLIAEIQKGNTVITPDKILTNGVWKGLVYVSLSPDATGEYAIGEQVGNGGWTTNQYTLTNWNDVNNKPQYAFEYDNGPQKFVYKDNPEKNILCRIKVDTYNKIVGGNLASGWEMAKHGKPCVDDNENGPYMFGARDHRFIVATDGAYFKSVSDNYDYWERNATIVNKMQQKLPGEVVSMRKVYPYWGTYRYDGATFLNYIQAMYSPAKKQVFNLARGMGSRYFSTQTLFGQYTPNLLGFPLMDVAAAAKFQPKNSSGNYQAFTNGTYYINDQDMAHPMGVITFGPLDAEINQAGGTGTVGFPLADPKEQNGYRYQLLQSDQDVSWKLADNSSSILPHIPYNCTFFGDYTDHWFDFYKMPMAHLRGILDSFVSLIDGVEALLKLSLEFAMYHPELIVDPAGTNKLNLLLSSVNKINYNKIISFFRTAYTQTSQALITEYDTSFGKKGCQARQWYIEGRLAGEFLLVYLPTKALTLESKLRVISGVDDVKYATQINKIVESIPTKWYKSTFIDSYDSFIYHYNQHVLKELPKVGKPIVSMEKYFDDAVNFFKNYDGSGDVLYKNLKDGTPGMLIRSATGRGGWFTGPGHPMGQGIPTTFWYY